MKRLSGLRRSAAFLPKDTWDDDRLNVPSTAPIEECRKAFKATSGDDLHRMLANVFQFDCIVNASDEMKEISRRAREVKLIGGESAINAMRVSRFDIRVEQAGSPKLDSKGAAQA